MAVNLQALWQWPIAEREFSYADRETMLYALAAGLGSNPVDERELPYVFEGRGLRALPTMAAILGPSFPWLRDPTSGLDIKRLLHGETGVTIHRELPPSGTVKGRSRIDTIVDGGEGKNASIYFTHDVHDGVDDALLASVTGCFVFRGMGGFDGPSARPPGQPPTPERSADTLCNLVTLPQAALFYRLTGDRNPLHADPMLAVGAGFQRPILHGSCTFAVAGRAVLQTACGYDSARLRRIGARFTAPMHPGETLSTELWDEGGGRFAFRCTSLERDTVVLNGGYAEINT